MINFHDSETIFLNMIKFHVPETKQQDVFVLSPPI